MEPLLNRIRIFAGGNSILRSLSLLEDVHSTIIGLRLRSLILRVVLLRSRRLNVALLQLIKLIDYRLSPCFLRERFVLIRRVCTDPE